MLQPDIKVVQGSRLRRAERPVSASIGSRYEERREVPGIMSAELHEMRRSKAANAQREDFIRGIGPQQNLKKTKPLPKA